MNILFQQEYLAKHLFFWAAASDINSKSHYNTTTATHIIEAMDLQTKLVSRVRTIYLLSREKKGQRKKELSAFWK